MLGKVIGTPWQPRGEARLTDAPKSGELLQAPSTPSKPRGVYITIERQFRHGQTPGCLGCRAPYGEIRPHSNECKRRFAEIIQGEKVEKPEDQDVRVAPPPESRGIAREAPPPSDKGDERVAKQARVQSAGDDFMHDELYTPTPVHEAADDPQEVPPMVLDAESGGDVNMNPNAGFIGGLPTLHD